MRRKILFLTAALILATCAPYSQLKPKPAVFNAETPSYVEIKKGDNDFDLGKNDKYFIAFPAPVYDHFYLIITSPQKKQFSDALTAEFAKKTPGKLIPDESWAPESMSVFAVDRSSPAYYWLIEKVPQKIEKVKLSYRYAPQWRFKFEHKYESYRQTLAKNRVDRTVYNAIGTGMHLTDFNYTLVIDTVSKHTVEIQKVRQDLADLAAIFPPDLVNSSDPAYLNYKELTRNVNDELDFQTIYTATLGFFYRENQTKGNPFSFLACTDDNIAYFAKHGGFPKNIAAEVNEYLGRSLDEVPSFLSQRLRNKDDAAPLDTAYFRMGAVRNLGKLYEAAGIGESSEMSGVLRFIGDFDAKSRSLVVARDSVDKIAVDVKNGPAMPPDDFFRLINRRLTAAQSAAPAGIDGSYGEYQGYPCAKKLNQEIGELNTLLLQRMALYHDAESLVAQLNVLKAQGEYSAMIGVLKQDPQAAFLYEKYRDLDNLSLGQQESAIGIALSKNSWSEAENGLKKFAADQNFLDPAILPARDMAVRSYEDSLYSRVESYTRARVNKFCEQNVSTYQNIDSLYTDSVFLPAYNITFSSEGRHDLAARQQQLAADLEKIKETEFPAKSIKLLYEQFVKSPDDNGVLKARAIVAHGKHYTGNENEVKMRIAEADPMTPKWITKPKEYRRVFVVPVTDNEHGKNRYVVRFNVKIQTDAKFPVYDVNIKLPREVAQNAATAQWYDQITCNGVPLKNEGRFTITAPTAANSYECQISPVQMNPDQANVLEISFHYPAFKVVQVSVMVQKPIIKKN